MASTITRRDVPRSQGTGVRPPLPPDLLSQLQRHFPPRRIEYIARVLSADELRVLGDLSDSLIIARIKRMPAVRLERFDEFVPKDRAEQKAYELLQLRWIRDEEYLLGERLGRSPTPRELFSDFMSRQNGLRFRAYYVMKYPHRMCRRSPVKS